jgi:hypothetical protein
VSYLSDGEPASPLPEGHSERAPRTNLLLSATIETATLKAPVRIRNLSEGGALLEGAAFPDVGGVLTLRRLEIAIDAAVVWRSASRCGIQFKGKAAVADWVSGTQSRSSHDIDQARVDSIQAAVRAGRPVPTTEGTAAPVVNADLDRRIAEELSYVKRLLEIVGDELTDAPIVVQRYSRSLQSFDLACQILGHLSTILTASNRGAAVQAVGMDDLRARLLRKPLFKN